MMASNRSIQPKGIKVHRVERELQIEWESGQVSHCSFADLRNSCPCAECRSERAKETNQLLDEASGELLLRSQAPLTLTDVQLIGNYALQLEWSDGHSHGIFTWEYLKSLCTDEND